MNIYILCPDTQQPIGGIKMIYQQIDILNRLGYKAFVLHIEKNFRCSWFNNTTAIAYFNEVKIEASDLVWVPENAVIGRFKSLSDNERNFRKLTGRYKYKHAIIDIWNINCRKWVFNQNAYLTFEELNTVISPSMLVNFYADIEAIICVSINNMQYLNTVFPQIKIDRIHYAINEARMFSYSKPENKERVITYMPRKNADHIKRVLPLLYNNPAIQKGIWKLKPLDGMPNHQIAKELNKAAVFASFGYPEGSPMPPKEALISGCLLVGYHGEGGQDYFPNNSKFNVPFGAVTEYANKLSEAIEYWDSSSDVENYTQSLSDYISHTYNEQTNQIDLERISKLF